MSSGCCRTPGLGQVLCKSNKTEGTNIELTCGSKLVAKEDLPLRAPKISLLGDVSVKGSFSQVGATFESYSQGQTFQAGDSLKTEFRSRSDTVLEDYNTSADTISTKAKTSLSLSAPQISVSGDELTTSSQTHKDTVAQSYVLEAGTISTSASTQSISASQSLSVSAPQILVLGDDLITSSQTHKDTAAQSYILEAGTISISASQSLSASAPQVSVSGDELTTSSQTHKDTVAQSYVLEAGTISTSASTQGISAAQTITLSAPDIILDGNATVTGSANIESGAVIKGGVVVDSLTTNSIISPDGLVITGPSISLPGGNLILSSPESNHSSTISTSEALNIQATNVSVDGSVVSIPQGVLDLTTSEATTSSGTTALTSTIQSQNQVLSIQTPYAINLGPVRVCKCRPRTPFVSSCSADSDASGISTDTPLYMDIKDLLEISAPNVTVPQGLLDLSLQTNTESSADPAQSTIQSANQLSVQSPIVSFPRGVVDLTYAWASSPASSSSADPAQSVIQSANQLSVQSPVVSVPQGVLDLSVLLSGVSTSSSPTTSADPAQSVIQSANQLSVQSPVVSVPQGVLDLTYAWASSPASSSVDPVQSTIQSANQLSVQSPTVSFPQGLLDLSVLGVSDATSSSTIQSRNTLQMVAPTLQTQTSITTNVAELISFITQRQTASSSSDAPAPPNKPIKVTIKPGSFKILVEPNVPGTSGDCVVGPGIQVGDDDDCVVDPSVLPVYFTLPTSFQFQEIKSTSVSQDIAIEKDLSLSVGGTTTLTTPLLQINGDVSISGGLSLGQTLTKSAIFSDVRPADESGGPTVAVPVWTTRPLNTVQLDGLTASLTDVGGVSFGEVGKYQISISSVFYGDSDSNYVSRIRFSDGSSILGTPVAGSGLSQIVGTLEVTELPFFGDVEYRANKLNLQGLGRASGLVDNKYVVFLLNKLP